MARKTTKDERNEGNQTPSPTDSQQNAQDAAAAAAERVETAEDQWVPATEAEARKAVEGFYAGSMPNGFRIRFGSNGRPVVTKRKT